MKPKTNFKKSLDANKDQTIQFLNQKTNLNIREISYQELNSSRAGFTLKGFSLMKGIRNDYSQKIS